MAAVQAGPRAQPRLRSPGWRNAYDLPKVQARQHLIVAALPPPPIGPTWTRLRPPGRRLPRRRRQLHLGPPRPDLRPGLLSGRPTWARPAGAPAPPTEPQAQHKML